MPAARQLLFRCRFALLLGMCFLLPQTAVAEKPEAKLNYNRDIRPILVDRCFNCHGPAEHSREAELRLDQREAAVKAGAIDPSDPDASEMIRRILSTDHDEVMPPVETKKPLTDEQKQKLVQWVKQGAEYQAHWSFLAPTKLPMPEVKNKGWVRTPIDTYILRRIEQAGLTPSPEADRETLIRRVSYDLTGLPPTLVDLDRFSNDLSAKWYETMVDHYLSQPAYGERMALLWLDASRYGDTSVCHADGPRDMWPWRDWVINAYNTNMPFNRFTIEQIAGDLLPNATPYQLIASGFNRNHATTDEGGAIAEEWRVDYVVDRVKTTSNVWMGLSMECAQCHSHKFDPISQEEYYGFFAFFNQTTDPGMQTRRGNQAPVVTVPDPVRDAKVAEIEKQVKEFDQKIAAYEQQIEEPFQQWLTEASAKAKTGDKVELPKDVLAHFTFDEGKGDKITAANDPKLTGKVQGKKLWEAGKFGSAFHVDRSNFIPLGNLGDFDQSESFSYGCWVKPKGNPNGVPIGKMDEGNKHRGWDLFIASGQVAVHIINSWSDNALKVTTEAKIPKDQWTHIFATYDGSKKAAGIKIYFNGKEQKWKIEANSLNGTTKTKVPLKIGRRNNSSPFNGLVDEVRIYNRLLAPSEVAALAGNDLITPILALDADKRSKEQLQTLRTHYLNNIDKQHAKLKKERAALTTEIDTLQKKKITSMVMGEQPKPRDTYLLMRGHYASPDKSKVIKPAIPKIFPQLPKDAPQNRLGLAQWLMSPDHPLTARVAVNRYWTMLFGKGIVSTPTDFGSQGAWPSHPELLDWLAVDFRENGWDVKRTLKQILMSATYRQSSRVTPQLAEKDPQNILLARGSRFRLQGELIRDTALAVSGLLVDKVGGPGTRPYQPPGLWNEVSLSGNVRFVADKGEGLYRKSMYIYWKRSAPHPGMQLFDAPTREKCVVQRARTNTPLQALYTMNDTQFVEASRAFAERIMLNGGGTPEARIAFGYRLVTSHLPSERATAALLNLYRAELSKFQENEAAAKELLSIGDSARNETLNLAEQAAWTVVANVLLNMDAALTRF